MDNFDVTVDSAGGTALVRPLGELDLASAPRMGAALTRLLRGDHHAVVMDLSRLTFSDCAGLRPIRRAVREARTRGTDIELRGAVPAVRRVLELTGLATPATLV